MAIRLYSVCPTTALLYLRLSMIADKHNTYIILAEGVSRAVADAGPGPVDTDGSTSHYAFRDRQSRPQCPLHAFDGSSSSKGKRRQDVKKDAEAGE